MPPKATVIVLAWNRWDLTQRCLDSLGATDLSDAEVLVVDNGSTDETPVRLLDYPWLRVLTNPENLGFVRGNNAGIAAVDPASDVVLVNNDVEFPQADWLVRLRACAADYPTAGVIGCRLRLPDGRLLHAGTYILPETMWGQQIGSLEKDIGQFRSTRPVEGIVFACAYIKRGLIDAIGGLSEDYQSYFEDTDYCLRAAEAGFETLVCGDVTLVHHEHGSTDLDPGQFEKIFLASRDVFRKKWQDRLEKRYRRDVLWQSIMNFPTGYAMSCREILRALDQQGVRAAYEYIYGPGTPFPVAEPEGNGDYVMNVIRGRTAKPDLAVVYGQGDVFSRNRGRRRIGFTMLEVDGFPPEWVRQANEMDEVWVPTRFNMEGFRASGLKRPIQTIPLGVDTNYFHPGVQAYPNPNGEFVFLSNFEWGERKEPWLLLKAFNDVFSAREPVRLVCKIINRDPAVRVREEIRKVELKERGRKDLLPLQPRVSLLPARLVLPLRRLLHLRGARGGMGHAAHGGHGVRPSIDRDGLGSAHRVRPPGQRVPPAVAPHDPRCREVPLLRGVPVGGPGSRAPPLPPPPRLRQPRRRAADRRGSGGRDGGEVELGSFRRPDRGAPRGARVGARGLRG